MDKSMNRQTDKAGSDYIRQGTKKKDRVKSQEEAQGKDEHKEMEINGNRNKKAKTKLSKLEMEKI